MRNRINVYDPQPSPILGWPLDWVFTCSGRTAPRLILSVRQGQYKWIELWMSKSVYILRLRMPCR